MVLTLETRTSLNTIDYASPMNAYDHAFFNSLQELEPEAVYIAFVQREIRSLLEYAQIAQDLILREPAATSEKQSAREEESQMLLREIDIGVTDMLGSFREFHQEGYQYNDLYDLGSLVTLAVSTLTNSWDRLPKEEITRKISATVKALEDMHAFINPSGNEDANSAPQTFQI